MHCFYKFVQATFYGKITTDLAPMLSVDYLDSVIATLTQERKKKQSEEAEAARLAQKASANAKKTKKQLKVEAKKHEDTWGGDFAESRYDEYNDLEDEFM